MTHECDYDKEDLEFDDEIDDDFECPHPEVAACIYCPDVMTCDYLSDLLDRAEGESSFRCRHDGECGGCPDFYDCPIIFRGDEEW